MKNDFTALGKRTTLGALKDAKIGTQRYLLGNFYDSRKEVNKIEYRIMCISRLGR
jgi:hypothetical protein